MIPAGKCFRPKLRFSLAMVGSFLVLSTNVRGASGGPGDPAGTPVPSVTFGIGPGDSVFAGAGRFRVVYDWRGDHLFRLIPVLPARSSSSVTVPLASPPTACSTYTIDQASSPFNVIAEYSAVCTIQGSATIWDIGGSVGIGTSTPSATVKLEVNGTAQFDTNVSGAVGNPSGFPGTGSPTANPGVVYHMDGVKYTTLDQIISDQDAGTAFTVYDDCPNGAETWRYDPFHDSSMQTHHVHLISAPCLITTNVPVMLKSGDTWDMTQGGYVSNATPTAGLGTVLRMGSTFPAQVSNSYAVASGLGPTFTGSSGDSSWTRGDFYWVGLTAANTSGETTLLNGNNSSSSFQSVGQYPSSGTPELQLTIPSITNPPVTEYCVYILQGTSSSFPSTTDAVGAGCYNSSGTVTINTYPVGANPPPGVNTTQSLLTLGSNSNYAGNISTRTYVQGGMIDCYGGAIGILNNMAQDPPSGIFNMTVENCTGNAGVLLEGFNGHLGANGSSLNQVFFTPSNCSTMYPCTGGGGSVTNHNLAWPTYAIHDDGVAQLKDLANVDIGADNCGTGCTMQAGVELTGLINGRAGARVTVRNIHLEGTGGFPSTTPGVEVNGVPADITGVHTAAQVTDSVLIDSGSTAVSVKSVIPYSGNYAIVDNVNGGYKTPPGQAIGFYDIEQPGNFLNVAGNSDLSGGLTLGGNLSLPAGGTVSSADTGTPKITFGTDSLTMNQPLTIAPPSSATTALAITPSANSTTTLNVENSSASSILSVDTTNGYPQEKLFDLCSPMDFSCNQVRENWVSGSLSPSGNVGQLGWTRTQIGSNTSTGTLLTGSFPDTGGIGIATSAASGDGQTWALGTTTTEQAISGLLGAGNWICRIRFQQPNYSADLSNGETFAIGLIAQGGLNYAYSTGKAALEVIIDTTIPIDTWAPAVCNDSGGCDLITSYVSPDAKWHTLQIYSFAEGQVSFQIDDNAVYCFTTGSSPSSCNGQTGSNVTYNADLPGTGDVLIPFIKDIAESAHSVEASLGRWAFEIKDFAGTGLP